MQPPGPLERDRILLPSYGGWLGASPRILGEREGLHYLLKGVGWVPHPGPLERGSCYLLKEIGLVLPPGPWMK